MALPQRKSSQNDAYSPSGNSAEVTPLPEAESTQSDYQQRQPTLRIGEILKRERERRGYDLQQIADYLCIRRGLLAALENSRYEEFPADAYVIGFLRSYAELIGLNGQEAINYYRQEMAGRRRKPDLVLPTPVSEGRAPTAAIMGAAALVSLIIYILWYAFSTSDRATVSTPPALPPVTSAPSVSSPVDANGTPAATAELPASAPSGIAISAPAPAQKTLEPAATPVPATTAPQTATAAATTETAASVVPPTSPAPAAASASKQSVQPPAAPAPISLSTHLVIRADQSSWVLIANEKGQTLYDRVMKPGDVYQVPDMPGLSLTTGNGAGITLTLDGADLPKLSSSASHMVRNISLEPKALKALGQ